MRAAALLLVCVVALAVGPVAGQSTPGTTCYVASQMWDMVPPSDYYDAPVSDSILCLALRDDATPQAIATLPIYGSDSMPLYFINSTTTLLYSITTDLNGPDAWAANLYNFDAALQLTLPFGDTYDIQMSVDTAGNINFASFSANHHIDAIYILPRAGKQLVKVPMPSIYVADVYTFAFGAVNMTWLEFLTESGEYRVVSINPTTGAIALNSSVTKVGCTGDVLGFAITDTVSGAASLLCATRLTYSSNANTTISVYQSASVYSDGASFELAGDSVSLPTDFFPGVYNDGTYWYQVVTSPNVFTEFYIVRMGNDGTDGTVFGAISIPAAQIGSAGAQMGGIYCSVNDE